MKVLIEITDEQYESAMAWWDHHSESCDWASGKEYAGAIGGTQSWNRLNTSIGPFISIKCHCGASFCVNMDEL